MSTAEERRDRAERRRQTATLHRVALTPAEGDPDPIQGAEAVSLVQRLTLESWSLSGREHPAYTREGTPYRFVARTR